MSLMDKMKKNKKLKGFIHSTNEKVEKYYHCGSITLNLLLSGKVGGGIPSSRVSLLAAPRAHMKSIISLIAAANAQRQGEIVIMIDSEFAFDAATAKMFGVDLNEEKFILIQDNSIENVQSIVMNIFEEYDPKEDAKIFMIVDSIGTMITSKTIEDALSNSDKADMTESKKKNKFAKLLLRNSGIYGATVVLIAHVYEDMKMYSTGAIGGGSASQYVSSSILKITSKRKEKDGNDITGNVFTALVEKGRFAVENSKLTFLASYTDGINPWYGLLDDAIEGGYVFKPNSGFYSRSHIEEDKKYRESQIYNKEFWLPIFKETDFKQYLESKYSYKNLLNDEDKVYDTTFEL